MEHPSSGAPSITRKASLESTFASSSENKVRGGSFIISGPKANPERTGSSTLSKDGKLPIEALDYPPSSSKYDFVKVKVWLEDHYYILSRFLVSRLLGTTAIPYADCVKISLDLKKALVDRGLLEVQQSVLEMHLFQVMSSNGYGELYRKRWQMMSRFHLERVPLIVLICGTGLVGKSFLATQLAERLNLPNVLQTNLVLEFMESMSDEDRLSPTHEKISHLPIMFRPFTSKEELVAEYKRECLWVQKGIEADVEKALVENYSLLFPKGKAVMVEGTHLDPALYLPILENHSLLPFPKWQPPAASPSSSGVSSAGSSSSSSSTQSLPPRKTSASATTDEKKGKKNPPKKGIIIPLIFNLKDEDHKLYMENMLSRNAKAHEFAKQSGQPLEEQSSTGLKNGKVIQKYLYQYSPPFEVVEVNASKYFLETLDEIHAKILDVLQRACQDGRFLPKEEEPQTQIPKPISATSSTTYVLFLPSQQQGDKKKMIPLTTTIEEKVISVKELQTSPSAVAASSSSPSSHVDSKKAEEKEKVVEDEPEDEAAKAARKKLKKEQKFLKKKMLEEEALRLQQERLSRLNVSVPPQHPT